MHQIWVISNREPEPLNLNAFIDLGLFVLELENAPQNSEVSVAVVPVSEIAELNAKYRQIEGPTDVLSFPCDDVTVTMLDGEPLTLGDVILSPEIAEENAHELGHTVEEELNLLMIHGVLHLLGYDHIQDEDAEVMQARERSILEAWSLQS
ncbi:MAG: rRNA maturation RNase YbeY [Coriobacteriia bacterium]|nr:rRNA maturation RNase YbeY [Coriobacteriia bacterium]